MMSKIVISIYAWLDLVKSNLEVERIRYKNPIRLQSTSYFLLDVPSPLLYFLLLLYVVIKPRRLQPI